MQTIKIRFEQESKGNKTNIGNFSFEENVSQPTKVIGEQLKKIVQTILTFGFISNVKVIISMGTKQITLPFTSNLMKLNFNILLSLPKLYFDVFESAMYPDTHIKSALLSNIAQTFSYKVDNITLIGYQTAIGNKLKLIEATKQKIILVAEKESLSNKERYFINEVKQELKEFKIETKKLLLPLQTVKVLPTDTVKEKNEATKKKRKTTKKPVPVTI